MKKIFSLFFLGTYFLGSTFSVADSSSNDFFMDATGHYAEEAIFSLAEDGILTTHDTDGTPRENFFPDESLTRAELTKLALLAFFPDETIGTSDELSPFVDVHERDWFFGVVETARKKGIIEGVTARKFDPHSPVTRAEASKILLMSARIPLASEEDPPFSDVSSDDWFAPYSTTLYKNCIQERWEEPLFLPHQKITRAEAASIIYNIQKIQSGEMLCPSIDTSEEDPTEKINSCDLSAVQVSPQSIATGSIPRRAGNVPVLVLDFSVCPEGSAQMTSITVSHLGLGNIEDIEKVKIFVGFQHYGNSKSLSNETKSVTFNLERDPLSLTAGSTIVTIAIDMNAETAGGEHIFSIESPDDITLISPEHPERTIEIEGSFPLRSNILSAK